MKKKLIFINNCMPELRKRVPECNIVNADFIRFQDGSGKVVLPTECRDDDVYVICDVNDKTPNPYSKKSLSPDDHVRDISRVVGALKDCPSRKSFVAPFLPYGRQHRKTFGESMEAADFLRECRYQGFENILTADAHDPDVSAAISKHNFDNMFTTNIILPELVINEGIDYENPTNILIVAPDEGAQQRARHFADRFGCNYAFFSKRRDVTKIVDGKNPLVSKQYVGFSPEGKTVIVVDDMIASGGTILETAEELKKMGAKNVYVCATFGLFTRGTDIFTEAKKQGLIDKTYVSNLTYMANPSVDGIDVIDGTEQVWKWICATHDGKENMIEELGMNIDPVASLVRKRMK